nr:FGGY family carbohydrate kinase [Colwellia maritima]
MLNATGLTLEQMPALFEGSEITGHLSADIAKQWGMNEVPVIPVAVITQQALQV